MNSSCCQISVIIPVYNNAPFIEGTLKSVVNQSFKNIEIILVDDGSTDNSLELAKQTLEDTNLTFTIIQQENSGVSCARNKGLANSKGLYVYFLDGDDQIEPDCLESLFLRMLEYEADAVICSYDARNTDGKVLTTYEKEFSYAYECISGPEYAVLMLKNETWACTGAVLWRKSFLERTGINYTKGAFNGQDVEFTIKNLSQASRVSCVDRVLMHYIRYNSSRNLRALWKRFHAVGCYLRLENYLTKNTADERLIRLVSNRAVPLSYVSTLNHLIVNGVSNEEYLRVIRNPEIVRRIRSAAIRLVGVKRYCLALFMVSFPKLYAFMLRRLYEKLNIK